MADVVIPSLMVAASALGFIAIVKVEAAARRAQRIYLARNRDHEKVPPMRWEDRP